MRHYLFVLLILTQLASCSLGGGSVPQDHYYRLPEIKLSAQQTVFDRLVMKKIKASGLYHDRAILYVERDRPLELKRYHYNFWAETPAELLHTALTQGLESSSIATSVSQEVMQNTADYIIDARILHFERIIQGTDVEINVALDIRVRSTGSAGVEWSKTYQAKQQLNTTGMHASAEAFGAAVQLITAQFVADLVVKK